MAIFWRSQEVILGATFFSMDFVFCAQNDFFTSSKNGQNFKSRQILAKTVFFVLFWWKWIQLVELRRLAPFLRLGCVLVSYFFFGGGEWFLIFTYSFCRWFLGTRFFSFFPDFRFDFFWWKWIQLVELIMSFKSV